MHPTSLAALLCFCLAIGQLRGINSAPIREQEEEALITHDPSALLQDEANFIGSEEELTQFLRRSRQEMEQSVKLNPANYVGDEMSAELIMAMFEQNESYSRNVLSKMAEELDECPICKSDLDEEPVHETHCRHKFHRTCLNSYARQVSRPTARRRSLGRQRKHSINARLFLCPDPRRSPQVSNLSASLGLARSATACPQARSDFE